MEPLGFALLILLIFTCGSSFAETDVDSRAKELGYIRWDVKTNKFWTEDGPTVDENWVAWASFSNQMESNGWTFLRVVTNEEYSDQDQAYAAGLIEGHLTCELMHDVWLNAIDHVCYKDEEICDKIWDYLTANKEWIQVQVDKYSAVDPYWHQVDLTLKQIEGLRDGCTTSFVSQDRHKVLLDFTFLMFSLIPEVYDLKSALGGEKDDRPGSCSALIKWIPGEGQGTNAADLYVGHNTWSGFYDMIRVLKNYEFHYHTSDRLGKSVIPGLNMTMSSYPGAVHSIDDFYLISSGLATMETTIENNNNELWKFVSPKSGVPEFIRAMLANRLATDGQTWTELFARHNSGTYNNQWMIVDYKRFDPTIDELNDELLWVIEQMPGFTVAEDRTNTLRNQGYWPSYNVPYFPSVFNMSGQQEMVRQYGHLYSYENCPRALIFRRDQHKVVDVDTMIQLLRSNDYLHDPLSVCNCTPTHNAMLALSSRGDLNPANGTYPREGLGHQAYGAIDMKMTTYEMFRTLQFMAAAGPTHESVPPFQWSTFDQEVNYSHVGMPDLWQFEPMMATWG